MPPRVQLSTPSKVPAVGAHSAASPTILPALSRPPPHPIPFILSFPRPPPVPLSHGKFQGFSVVKVAVQTCAFVCEESVVTIHCICPST